MRAAAQSVRVVLSVQSRRAQLGHSCAESATASALLRTVLDILVDARLACFKKMLKLSGRLELALAQVSSSWHAHSIPQCTSVNSFHAAPPTLELLVECSGL